MLAHRNTLTEETESSPVQRLMGRRTKTLLPTTTNLLRPHGTDITRMREQDAGTGSTKIATNRESL